jgi:hypothetical protein
MEPYRICIFDYNKKRTKVIVDNLSTCFNVNPVNLMESSSSSPSPTSIIFVHISDLSKWSQSRSQPIIEAIKGGCLSVIYTGLEAGAEPYIIKNLASMGIRVINNVCIIPWGINDEGIPLRAIEHIKSQIVDIDNRKRFRDPYCLRKTPPIHSYALMLLCQCYLMITNENVHSDENIFLHSSMGETGTTINKIQDPFWWRSALIGKTKNNKRVGELSIIDKLRTEWESWEIDKCELFSEAINNLINGINTGQLIQDKYLIETVYNELSAHFSCRLGTDNDYRYVDNGYMLHEIKQTPITILAIYEDNPLAVALAKVMQCLNFPVEIINLSSGYKLPPADHNVFLIWSSRWNCDTDRHWLSKLDRLIKEDKDAGHRIKRKITTILLEPISDPLSQRDTLISYMKVSGAVGIKANACLSLFLECINNESFFLASEILDESDLFRRLCKRLKSCINHGRIDQDIIINELSSLVPALRKGLVN